MPAIATVGEFRDALDLFHADQPVQVVIQLDAPFAYTIDRVGEADGRVFLIEGGPVGYLADPVCEELDLPSTNL